MSNLDSTNLYGFLEPTVKQYGSNMIMTNVVKPTKKKIINIDSRFTDDYIYPRTGFNQISNYTFTLPEKVNEVKSIAVSSIEIPVSFYNISAALGNSYFTLVNGSGTKKVVQMDDGNYVDLSAVYMNIQTKVNAVGVDASFSIAPKTSYTTIKNGSTTYEIDFNTDICGNSDKYNFRSKLGWLLGYRDPSFSMTSSGTFVSPSAANLNSIRYLYLVVDEFSNSFPNSFVSPMSNHIMNKKILARISIDNKFYPYGFVINANHRNGFLVSDVRKYQGKVDIQRLNVQLVNEFGIPVNLNGLDFSFVLEIDHE
jgi:hypothetical protein